MLFKIKSDLDFSKVALLSYDNPGCLSYDEFIADISRVRKLNRVISKFNWEKEEHYRKIVNYFIVIHNLFGVAANYLIKYRVSPDNNGKVAAILLFLNRLSPELWCESDVDRKFLERLQEL